MPLIDIVSCYVKETIPFSGDLEALVESFEQNGFRAKKIGDRKWKLKRGAALAATFQYDSEALEMKVYLEQNENGFLQIRVGNSGFPFEPLLMKKRFIRNLDRYTREIRERGRLGVDPEEREELKQESRKKKVATIAALIAITLFVLFRVVSSLPTDRVIQVDPGDPEMNAAMAEAKKSLPTFWKIYENPENGETDFSIKVRLSSPEGTEHFWCIHIKRDAAGIRCTIDNDPDRVDTVQAGREITVRPEQITDWFYLKDGKMYGNYTVRPLLKRMDPRSAEEIRVMLADP